MHTFICHFGRRKSLWPGSLTNYLLQNHAELNKKFQCNLPFSPGARGHHFQLQCFSVQIARRRPLILIVAAMRICREWREVYRHIEKSTMTHHCHEGTPHFVHPNQAAAAAEAVDNHFGRQRIVEAESERRVQQTGRLQIVGVQRNRLVRRGHRGRGGGWGSWTSAAGAVAARVIGTQSLTIISYCCCVVSGISQLHTINWCFSFKYSTSVN